MFLSDQAVKEFKEIYESKFQEKLSDGEYRLRAENLLRLMKLLVTPTKKDTTTP